jgi:tRNA dimethylallyltransferase
MSKRLLAIVGPTATGKTEVGLLLAEMLGGEIVSADSMQVYRGMDIGTAKSSGEQRARVRHHLIDIVEPEEPFSVACYQSLAEQALADIWARGRQPILVGGSGLYVRAVVDGLDLPLAPPDPELRRRLVEEAQREGAEALHARLAARDPEAAARIHPHNVKRVIRALEVYARTGEAISEWWQEASSYPTRLDQSLETGYNARALEAPRPRAPRGRGGEAAARQFGLVLARAELYARIEARVDRMVSAGLVEEVRGLVARGLDQDLVAMKGLGYAQIGRHLRGEYDFAEAVRRLKGDTKRFAKRQLTWFRADPRIEWVDVSEAGGPAGAARIIEKKWSVGCG